MILKYDKSIDRKLKIAFEKVLKTKVIDYRKILAGEVNHVYKVESTKGIYIARVFRNRDWPEDGKLQWIERKLQKHSIPHAKIAYYSRKGPYFPYGFMITEYIEGKMAETAIEDDDLTHEQFYTEVGKVLKRIHKIKTRAFGGWVGTLGYNKKYINELQDKVKKRLREIKHSKIYSVDLEENVITIIGELLWPLKAKIKPVLTHGDPGKDNCIWTKEKKLVLIDWDNALSSTWIRDYANLTYWGSYNKKLGKNPQERRKRIKKAFLKGYGKTNLTAIEIDKAEKAVQIHHAVNLLPYYYLNKRMKAFSDAKKHLFELLNY